MKSLSLGFKTFLSGAVLMLAVQAHAQDAVLSVRDWTRDLKSALEKNQTSEVKRLTDISGIESSILNKKDSLNEQALLKGRKLFAQGKFDQALTQYDLIEKGSAVWLQAVEEKGWAFLRKNEIEKSLAQTKTLLSESFLPVAGSESFFLQSLAQLKICDYKGVLETHTLFKKTQRQRLLEIQNLADGKTTPAFQNVIAKADLFPLQFRDLGDEAKALPLQFQRDLEFQKQLLRVKMAEAGTPLLKSAYASFKEAKVLAEAIQKLQKNSKDADSKLKARMKVLAQNETDDNFKMLQKLNLVEVETIERVHADLGLDKSTYSKGQFAQTNNDQLIFPDDGHPWIDELDKYQVKVNSCPQNIRRKM